jgi:hypothetical protein
MFVARISCIPFRAIDTLLVGDNRLAKAEFPNGSGDRVDRVVVVAKIAGVRLDFDQWPQRDLHFTVLQRKFSSQTSTDTMSRIRSSPGAAVDRQQPTAEGMVILNGDGIRFTPRVFLPRKRIYRWRVRMGADGVSVSFSLDRFQT